MRKLHYVQWRPIFTTSNVKFLSKQLYMGNVQSMKLVHNCLGFISVHFLALDSSEHARGELSTWQIIPHSLYIYWHISESHD